MSPTKNKKNIMNRIKQYTYLLGLSLIALTTACEDQSTEITEIDYNRLFAPINLEARVVNQVNARLTWTAVTGASSYNIEVYANDSLTFNGSPVKTITEIGNADIPYVITDLEGETQYSIRIQAIGENITESKWSGVFFETGTEQIFKNVTEEDLTESSATLHWTAGATATTIVLTPGDITHNVTSAEIEAGAATINGLQAETAYTAKLMNGTKTRGTVSFTTLIDLDGAIAVKPEDDFIAMLGAAQDGDAFAFYPGTYSAPLIEGAVSKITISKSIEIKAVRPSDRPILNTCFTLSDGASLNMKQVVLNGENTDGSQAFEFTTATTYDALVIDDCEIRNYTKGFYYVNVAAEIGEITVNNCLIHDIECNGGDLFDCRKGYIKAINITNNTLWNSCAARDFVRYDDASGNFAGAAPIITIDHCTLDGVSNNSSRRLFYVRFKGNSITFTNNMVSNMPDCGRGFSDNSATAEPTFKNNNYYNTVNLVSNDGGTAKFYDTEGTTLNPGYKDTANGDFTLSDEDLIYNAVGDPRWYK